MLINEGKVTKKKRIFLPLYTAKSQRVCPSRKQRFDCRRACSRFNLDSLDNCSNKDTAKWISMHNNCLSKHAGSQVAWQDGPWGLPWHTPVGYAGPAPTPGPWYNPLSIFPACLNVLLCWLEAVPDSGMISLLPCRLTQALLSQACLLTEPCLFSEGGSCTQSELLVPCWHNLNSVVTTCDSSGSNQLLRAPIVAPASPIVMPMLCRCHLLVLHSPVQASAPLASAHMLLWQWASNLGPLALA